MWQRILALIVKELWAVWRDKKSRMILIVPPIVQMVLFSFATTLEVKNIEIAVINRDMGGHGIEMVQRLAGSKDLVKRVRMMSGEAQAANALASQSVLMILRIPADFSRTLDAGKSAELDLMLDGRKSNAAQILEGYVTTIAQQYALDLAGGRASGAAVAPRAFFNPNLESAWNTVPALTAILTMIMGLVVTGLSVARERELGTFEQLLVSPARPIEIIVGKTVPGMVIGLAEGSVIVAFAHFVFAVPLTGSVPLLYLGMAVYLASVIGVGLFISSLVATQQQAMLGAFTFVAPAILLSGFATPIANMPDWLQTVTLGNPARYFLVIIKGVFLKDMPAAEVLGQIGPMALIALITLSAASWLFRHRLE
ncbi:MAG TPA: ABC transporter permease [Candidatus Sulfotelmatobacter sp.]|jgi:ABC-2 type transport system permease protein|nr:ABC transporter permease [Candidatus Sulfotelmatobacter sp.]